jgi:hypothetical protein
MGVLLDELNEAKKQQDAYHNARWAQSVRTLIWWRQMGVTPRACGVTDRWGWGREDDRVTNVEQILEGVKEGRFDGIEVEAPNSSDQYEVFEQWVRTNVRTLEDLYLYFVHQRDHGVRKSDTGAFEVVSWEWGDMPPANVSETWKVDPRIDKFMRGIRDEIVRRTEQEMGNLTTTDLRLGPSGKFKLGRKRRARSGQSFFTTRLEPGTGLQLHAQSWNDLTPVFYEIEHKDVPSGFVLVTGADAQTYLAIVEARVLNNHAETLVIGDSNRLPIETPLPETGWKDLRLPVILVPADSLE